MVGWHMLEDLLGWVAVLAVGVVLQFVDWYFLDAAVSIAIVIYVCYGALKHLRTTLSIFLQGVPPGISPAQIETKIGKMPQVKSVHHTHLWSLDGQHHVLTMHIRTQGISQPSDIIDLKNKAKAIIKTYGIGHATIEIELEGEACFMGG
jgi:cobalt-zinc-cadmium efflux system protein